MKKILLAALCLPVFTYAQTYTYSKILTKQYGSDNFSFDREYCFNVAGGKISLNKDTLYIDNKAYILKPKKMRNVYRAKKCTLELVYDGQKLAAVKQFRYNEVNLFVVDEQAPVLAAGTTRTQ